MTGPESAISHSCPVSPAQERLWFLDRTHPGIAAGEPREIRLRGKLQEAALAAALGEIVHRHEVLRTVFREHHGEPVQIVQPWAGVPLPRVDLSGLPETARETAARLARRAAARPFDLAQGPLLRALLLRLNAAEHLLLLQVHPIATDAWSSDVLDRELAALYQHFAGGGAPLPPPPLQYADFAVWQRRWSEGAEAAAQLAAWSERLAGLPAVLELPADRPRPAVQSFRGRIERMEVPSALEEPLAALGLRSDATFFMTLLAAFQTLLHRITGSDDLAVGIPVANRSRPELQRLVGPFANRLAVRADLAGDPSFVAALGRVREAVLFAQAHQELPFERLAAELAPAGDLPHAPIFQVFFSLAETPPPPLEFGPDLRGEAQAAEDGAAGLDLSLRLIRHAQGLTASLEYASDLFDPATAVRLLTLLRVWLAGIAAAPEARLSELPLLPPAEREQILYQWNRTAASILETPVQQLFEAHARRAPEALAVSWNGGSMTYGELNRRANHLAHRLRELGARPESLVAILLERSAESVIAVVATVKAGAAWMPIDPANPGERIAAMLRDSGAAVLLTVDAQLSRVPDLPLPPERVLRLDGEGFPAESTAPPAPFALDPDHLAYVIYTSGSTGMPKGAALTHGSLANLVSWDLRAFERGPEDRAPLLAGPGFDASVWEIWPTLAAGASLHVPLRETLLSPPALLAWLAAERITLTFIATPLAVALLEEIQAAPAPPRLALRALLTGGDRLIRRPWPELSFPLINMYGPTETTVYATGGLVTIVTIGGTRPPHIGTALDNTRIYLVDRHLRPVPVGIPGELYIAGAGLARGYRGRPELTAERFVPNPLATPEDTPGQRMYRTGDLARWLPGGEIEFLGRIDHQVKIRGIRIELGEIESVLAAQPEVAATVVMMREDATGDRRLVAYVVAPGGISAAELRERLARRLPAAMVPSSWVFLDALPLNPNGKLDRRALERIALAEPEAETPPDGSAGVPQTPIEQLLADLVREVLKLPRPVSSQDDFFHLGGHSLLVVQLASRASALFGVDIDIRTVFDHPTVAGLAGWIAAALGGGRTATAPIVPAVRGAESPLSYAQQRLWFLDRFESGTSLYNVPLVFHLAGSGLRILPLTEALDEIVRRHEALRTVFREPVDRETAGGEPVQVVQPSGIAGALPTLPIIDLSALPDARNTVVPIERELADRPFDLVRGPLLRCCLLRLSAEEHHLVVSMHHIASDGWSLEVLVRETSELYQAFAQGLPSSLPPLPIQYADFAIWQRRWLAGETLEAELAWWRERLAGLPPVLELPSDRPRPARQSFRGDLRDSRVEPRVGAGLAALGRRHGATLFMTLAAAFYSLLFRYTGEEDLAVGTPIAGRSRAETADLIGFFVNTLVLRASLAGDPAFPELLSRVRTTALDAFVHQDLPFERLVAELAPERDLSRTPLFQVMFALWETTPALDLAPGLKGSTAELPTSTAKWDLFLQISRDGDELRPTAEYATDLFDAAAMDRLLGHLGTLLAGIVAAPETRISELPLLTGPEREQLRSYGAGAEPVPLSVPALLGLFEAHVRSAPEALAVSWSSGSMTYGELDRRANHLAHRLQGLGVRPESVVAILLERSAETVIAVVATVKAGGAWLPIDPVNPGERIAAMLRDSGATVLLTVTAQLARVPDLPLPPERVLRLDGEDFPDESTPPPVPFAIDPDHLAYVIYTSGSTGTPKGAALPYRGLANLVGWDLRAFGRGPEDRATLLAGPGFDASVWEIWPTLAAGASLHIPRKETILSPPDLLAWLAAERITLAFIATPLAVALLEEMQAAPAPPRLALRALLTGGDRLVRRPWPELSFPLINMYGPTETTVYATGGLVTLTGSRAPHIGTALDGTRVYLVDRHLRPVPVGIPGELCITGAGLARGYLGRPELTAERFVPNPLATPEEPPGERMYRTGDLARWLPGGEIDFLGRIDHQVKIRGIRIELGEIESVLAAQPEVAAAVVMMRDGGTGDRRLVAYVVAPGGSGAVSAAELRERLTRRLPAAMVPAAWVFLDALPLNANGKLDRRALERIAIPELEADVSADTPQTPVEQLLADLVREVLKLPRPVSSQDDFFHLGGHSLLVVQLASRASALFEVDVDIRTVFDHPTVAGLAGWIADALRGRPTATAPIVPIARGVESPLSFAQQRLWFLDRFESGGTSLYNVPVAIHLTGSGLLVSALASAFDEIVRRHEVLRTVFRESADSEPVQVVQPFAAGALPVVDLSGLPVPRAEAELVERELADRPFDLVNGPLLYRCLLRLKAEEHHLVVSMHHIASDGWSLEVLVRELSELYQAFAQGLPSPLPPLPIQYVDFAVWQRHWLAGEVIESELAWWREQLAGLPPGLELPADRPRPARQSFRGSLRHGNVEARTGAGLAALSRRQGATLFMTLTAAFYALLHRYTGVEDLALGTPIAGRNRAETEGLIGFFINTLVLRTSLAGDVGFLELLARVRTAALDAYAHQDLPFEQLVAELSPQRDSARTPLFQVLFALQETELPKLYLGPGLEGPMVGLKTSTAKFDLALQGFRNGDELRLSAEYATDLFDAATVDRLLAHLSTLLAGIAAAPETGLSLLPLLTAGEREQLAAWNATCEPRPAGATLHGLFAAQAERTPDAVAVIAAEGSLTYRELDERSDRLARRLVALGAGIDSRVGLFLERSLEMVVALLGVLKAGAAYVPLDPDYPAQRLAAMVDDAQVVAVLAQERLADRLPAGAPVLFLDADQDREEGSDLPAPATVPEETAAYLIFTSGSTGKPKATVVPHRAIVNYILWMQAEFSVGPTDRVLQKTAFSFDASVWVFFAPLLSGATLVMARPEEHRDPAAVIRSIREHGVTVLPTVPSMLRALLEEGLEECRSLRRVFCGGEALGGDVQTAFFAAQEAELINLYGPTETTVAVTFWRCERERATRPALLGRAIPNARLHVLGSRLEPCPAGVPGELCVGGEPVSRGYLGRPVETASSFLPDPFAVAPGARLYRTGDLVRRRPDGLLEYLGRVDHQVKIRGFRIELGEIEAALSAHPAVAAAVALVREMGGELRVLAFVKPAGEAPTAAELRAHLERRLPAYMLPSGFSFLAELPLLPSGKVDRKALAAEPVEPLGAVGGAPRTETERVLAAIWQELLGVAEIGLHDDFFRLGGHSLLVMRLTSLVRKRLAVELELRTVFEETTLGRLAARIERDLLLRGSSSAAEVPEPGERPGAVPLSYAQQRLWFLDRLQPGMTVYNLPVLFRLTGPLAAGSLAAALSEIVRRHGVLRTTFAVDGESGEPVQVVAAPTPWPLPRVDLSGLPAALRPTEAERLLAAERLLPFDLARGPLLRSLLVRLGPQEHRLALTMHHVVSDGWSVGVLGRELQALYGAAVAGEPSPLPELPWQYAGFSLWQRQWLGSGELEAQLAWWKETLAGTIPALDLTTDRPRPAVQSLRGGLATLPLGPALSAAVEQLGGRQGTTRFMTLLAAFKALLCRYSGQEDLWVGTAIANRNHERTEELIGFFVNTLVLRTRLGGDPTFAGLLGRVRETALAAYAHQDLPFEKLVEELAPTRDLSRSPLFQVAFAHETERPAPAGLAGGVTLEPLPLTLDGAKLDLSLAVEAGAEGLEASVEFATDLFDAATIQRLLAHFHRLLASVTGDPEGRISELPLLSAEEREEVLSAGRDAGPVLPDMQVYIVDHALRLVPVGLRGELCIAGAGLARGYRGRPGLTAERFVPNPLGDGPGERLFRTGNLARWLPGGRIEFLGRIGKVDRRALPAPAHASRGFVPPRTPLEELIADIWRTVLGVGRVGADDNFWDLGGHSLIATKVLARVRDTFGIDLPLQALFAAPRLSEFAAAVGQSVLDSQAEEAADLLSELDGLSEEEIRALLAAEGQDVELAGEPAVALVESPSVPVESPQGVTLPRGSRRPLSFAQQRLWFLDQLTPGSPVYNIPLPLRLEGSLEPRALAAAMSEIVRRHEVLRTTYAMNEGEPDLVIQPARLLPLPLVDLTALPAETGRNEARRLAAEDALDPFDLAAGPIVRASLVRCGLAAHVLLCSVHHIAFDGWSAGLFLAELAALYDAFATGRESPLPEPPWQYADFAAWQRSWLTGEVYARQLAFWQQALANAPEVLELPADRTRPPVQSLRGEVLWSPLPPAVTAALRALARERSQTLFVLVLAGFQALLKRYTGQDDLLVGTPVAGRHHAEVEGLIGLFVNTLALRGDLTGDPSFDELLARTRETWLAAFTCQDLPFEVLVEALRPERDMSRSPLVQVMLMLENAQPQRLNPAGLRLVPMAAELRVSKLDLTLGVVEEGDGLRLSLEYATDLFEAATIERLAGHFATLLEGAASEPGRRLSELPLLTPGERQQLAAWNATLNPRPAGATLHGLFAVQAERTPDAVAGIAAEGTLTYRELDERSDRLARRLVALGAGIDSRVGLFLERSLEMVVALLGVLKAGAAYVPLDPDYPAERLAAMLEDAQAVAVLAQERLVNRLPAGVAVLCLDRDGDREDPGELPAMPAMVPEEAAAYLIFTSGSTGRPKATIVPHRAIVNHMLWMQAEFPPGPADRVLQKTAFSFDASVWEFWAPLLSGSTLVMARPGEHREPAALIRSIREHGVTVLQTVPTLLRALLEDGGLSECRSLRRVFCGGEALGADVQTTFFATLEAELVNLYGPTETTVEITFWRCERALSSRPALLGGPIPNARLHVLGPRWEPCPVGVPGELFVGGEPVSRGYLGRPVETASSFLPDPFAAPPGARLYRTGDRVRRRPDGLLEYLGRTDHQVKVRGYRIELGEVEAAIAACPGVRAVAAVVRDDEPGDDRPGDRRLVAYVVADGEEAGLRGFLKERLPEHMAPTAWVFLDALPLTPNGKVDHRALPAPTPRASAGHELVAPRTHLEERVADLWRAVLKVDRLGIHDSFWELGGHSLLAIRLAFRVSESFGVELPVRTLFEHPTLAGYAAAVAELLERPGERVERITRRTGDGPAPLSPAQQRLWFLDCLQPGLAVYNLPVLFSIAGPLAAASLAAALSEIVRRHDVLRTTFVVDGQSGEPVQVVAEPVRWLLPRVDLAGLPAPLGATEAERLLAAERRLPFDLARGPLLRSLLVRLGPLDHRLALTLHHIISDGWSIGVLRRELQALYSAASTDRPSPLSELAVQYADFSVWQRRWQSGEWEAQLAWWRETLAGAPSTLDLPTDRPRPAVPSLRGDLAALPLGPALSAAAEQLGRRRRTTPFMTLLAAFEVLLFRYTGQEDLWVGTPIANRRHAETEDLLGFFVNTLVLRLDASGDPTFDDLLGRVRETAVAAYAHQDLPFEKLVEELAPARDLSRSPLFQVLFAADSERTAPAELAPGVTLETLAVDLGTAKLDLSLSVEAGREELEAVVEWATDLFDTATIQRLLSHFRALLTEAVGNPATPISELPLLTAEERAEVVAFGRRAAAPLLETPVQQLFEAHARRAPEALAVSWTGGSMTYGELDRRANQLAHRLRGLGVRPESVVAILLERSAESVIAVVATVKAGGAWMPIDPVNPGERITTMLRDSGATVLLTVAAQLARLTDLPLPTERVLRLDGEGFTDESSQPPVPFAIEPDHLAYVIYTSGSTGTPKGAALPYRGLANLVSWDLRTFGRGPEDRAPLLSGPGFDASVWEIWATLAAGASLHVPSKETILSPSALLAWMAAERITLTFLATPLGVALMEEIEAAPLPPALALRTLLTGGDRLVRRPGPELAFPLFNIYGPTETTVYATLGVVTPTGTRAPHIGTPLDNTWVHLVDRHLQPVPVGLPGELCIAGAGLARGYLGRPELTAERFVPNPLATPEDPPGERMYRTGDLARWLPGGEIEFLGRIDHQVKIRGIRIELGEIESVLAAQPEVAAAVVTLREDETGDRQLVAYVVAPGGISVVSAGELRERLARRLPAAMVPAAWVFLDALPLNPNGKLDRRALPAPEPTVSEHEFIAPRTPLEEKVAEIWRTVLRVDRVGIDDNFWDLGGHSLIATKVLTRVREAFDIDLPLQSLFTAPRLEEFAAAVGHGILAARGVDAADLLSELDGLSEDEIRSLLAAEAGAVEELT